MREIVNTVSEGKLAAGDRADQPGELEARIRRSMLITVALATTVSALVFPWRVTTGLLLGGTLSLLNHLWLRRSVSAALQTEGEDRRPKLGASAYILRYFAVFAIVAVAYQLNIISLTSTIAGLCSFVVALFAEAFRQSYFAIIHREESN